MSISDETNDLAEIPSASNQNPVAVQPKKIPLSLGGGLDVILDQNANAFAVIRNEGNPYALLIGSRALNNIIRAAAAKEGTRLSRAELTEINEHLRAHAEMSGKVTWVWQRIAQIEDGVEIDLGDPLHRRVRINAGRVEIVESGSDTIFYRSEISRAMVIPAENGDICLLRQYVNLDATQFFLCTAWMSYVLAHSKVPNTKFPILLVSGGQGTGKSYLSRLIRDLIDPASIDVQVMPSTIKDLSIATQHSHVLCLDNMRNLPPHMSDALCMTSTGGKVTGRQLYTDSGQIVLNLHAAVMLNGIHSLVEQSDLAERSLPLYLKPIGESNRKSESEMQRQLQTDMPIIQRGLFNMVAKGLLHLSQAKVTRPHRMLDFCRWLAALEIADGIPAGIFQEAYSEALTQGQLNALLDNHFAATVLEFAEGLDGDEWSDTPAKLLIELNARLPRSTHRSRDWPDNPIALSKRLQSLQAGLLTQEVRVEFSRGKERTITIWKGTKS